MNWVLIFVGALSTSDKRALRGNDRRVKTIISGAGERMIREPDNKILIGAKYQSRLKRGVSVGVFDRFHIEFSPHL